MDVTVLEMADRLMNRVTCAEVSAFYRAEHERQGVAHLLWRDRPGAARRRGAGE